MNYDSLQAEIHHVSTGTNPSVSLESLRLELRETTSQRDRALADLKERDARVQRLLHELQGLVSLN